MQRRRLSEWANVAEVISAVAVIVSLLYVGYQINENTAEIRAANRQELVNRSHTATMGFATSPELSGVMAKVAAGEALDQVEETQYAYAVRTVLYDVQEAFLLHQEGRLDEGYWKTRHALISEYLSKPAASEIYDQIRSRGLLHGEFVRWVDGVIGHDGA